MTAIDVLKVLVAGDDANEPETVQLAIEAAREILSGDQEELDDELNERVDRLAFFGLEVELYLADRYNLDAAETAIVFTNALANTLAYNLNADVTTDAAIRAALPELKSSINFRRANPPTMGLRDIVREFKRTGGKVRLS